MNMGNLLEKVVTSKAGGMKGCRGKSTNPLTLKSESSKAVIRLCSRGHVYWEFKGFDALQ